MTGLQSHFLFGCKAKHRAITAYNFIPPSLLNLFLTSQLQSTQRMTTWPWEATLNEALSKWGLPIETWLQLSEVHILLRRRKARGNSPQIPDPKYWHSFTTNDAGKQDLLGISFNNLWRILQVIAGMQMLGSPQSGKKFKMKTAVPTGGAWAGAASKSCPQTMLVWQKREIKSSLSSSNSQQHSYPSKSQMSWGFFFSFSFTPHLAYNSKTAATTGLRIHKPQLPTCVHVSHSFLLTITIQKSKSPFYAWNELKGLVCSAFTFLDFLYSPNWKQKSHIQGYATNLEQRSSKWLRHGDNISSSFSFLLIVGIKVVEREEWLMLPGKKRCELSSS